MYPGQFKLVEQTKPDEARIVGEIALFDKQGKPLTAGAAPDLSDYAKKTELEALAARVAKLESPGAG